VDTALVFRYDHDVLPVLETIISKTLEQGLMEVLQEEELDFMRRRTVTMLADREKQKQVMQTREDQERELDDKKRALLKAAGLRRQAEQQVQNKVAARVYAKQFLRNLNRDVFSSLTAQHFFEEPVHSSVRAFMPLLYASVEQQLSLCHHATQTVDAILLQNVSRLVGLKQQRRRERAAKAESARAHTQARKDSDAVQAQRQERLDMFIHCAEIRNSPIGPIKINGNNTFGDVIAYVATWLKENANINEPDNFRFFWKDKLIDDPGMILFQLGMDRLSEIRLVIEGRPEVQQLPTADAKDEEEE